MWPFKRRRSRRTPASTSNLYEPDTSRKPIVSPYPTRRISPEDWEPLPVYSNAFDMPSLGADGGNSALSAASSSAPDPSAPSETQ